MKKQKKGYMRTMEAFFAFFITFIFVVFIVLKGGDFKTLKTEFDVLSAVEQRDDFRNCIYAENTTCAENLIDSFFPASYDYELYINNPKQFSESKDIYTETLFMVSNQTNNYNILYLYYWVR